MTVRYVLATETVARADRPFKALLIAERPVGIEARASVSEQLVAAGCLYFMAWGEGAEAWQDAVNLANLQAWDYGTIPDDKLVIATSHPRESLDEVFWYARHTALHPCDPLADTWLLHITETPDESGLLQRYENA